MDGLMFKKWISMFCAVLFVFQLSVMPADASEETESNNGVVEFFSDDFTTQPETEPIGFQTDKNGYMTRDTENGEMVVTVEKDYCLTDIMTPIINDTENKKIVFEADVSQVNGTSTKFTVKLRVGNGADNGWKYNYKELYSCAEACRLYIVLDRENGAAYVYKEGSTEPVASNTDYFPKGDMETWKAVQVMFRNSINSSTKSVHYDYMAVYSMPESFHYAFQNVTTEDAELVTSEPISLDSIIVLLESKAATVKKEREKYNTYKITWSESLERGTTYTGEISPLSALLGGEELTCETQSFSVTTPPKVMGIYSAPEIYFFDDFTQTPETEPFAFNLTSNSIVTRDTDNSEMVVGVKNGCLTDINMPEIKNPGASEVVFEVETGVCKGIWTSKLRVGTSSTWTKNYTDLITISGSATRLYIVYNRETGVATVYNEGKTEPVATIEGFPAGAADYTKLQLMARNSINSSTKTISYDYFAAYENKKDFSFEIQDKEQTQNDRIIIKTTKPISVKNTVFTVDGQPTVLKKVPDSVLTYEIIFNNKLQFNKTYTLFSNSICDLSGENMIYEESMQFTTKDTSNYAELAEFSDLTFKSNDEKTDFTFSDGTVNASADVTAYKDNTEAVIAIAEYQNGRMTGLSLENKKMSGKDKIDIDYQAKNTENTVLKVFLLENSSNLKPIKSASSLAACSGEKIETVDTEFFPGWKRKAVTLSYDDGSETDENLIRLFKKYGVRATFNIVSSWVGSDARKQRFSSRYEGFELASHSDTHQRFSTLTMDQFKQEVDKSCAYIREITGYDIKGFVWPYSGTNDSQANEYLKSVGIKYSRNAGTSHSFDIPETWVNWTTTCTKDTLNDDADRFFALQPDNMQLLSIWGHSSDLASDWSIMESFLEKLSKQNDIWSATNIEIVDYVNAVRTLEITEDYIKNNSEVTVYAKVNGKEITIGPGSAYRL